MTEEKKDPYDGLKIYTIDLNLCGSCTKYYLEETDYPYFISEDGELMAVPEDCPPPASLCMRGEWPQNPLFEKQCPDYVKMDTGDYEGEEESDTEGAEE